MADLSRRSFLKRVGAATLAIAAAPLFIPSERLDFGVPHAPIVLPTDEDVAEILSIPESYQAFKWNATTASFYIPEVWSKDVVRALDQRLVFADLIGKNADALIWHGATVKLPPVRTVV